MAEMKEANSKKIAELTEIGGKLTNENEEFRVTIQNLDKEKKSSEMRNGLLDANFNKIKTIWEEANAKMFELQIEIEEVNYFLIIFLNI